MWMTRASLGTYHAMNKDHLTNSLGGGGGRIEDREEEGQLTSSNGTLRDAISQKVMPRL